MARVEFAYAGNTRIIVPDVRVDMVETDQWLQVNGWGATVAVVRSSQIVGWSPSWEFLRCTEGR